MKRMNKKGFTLIELLAVIAILGILMLLVMPNVLSMFTSGRKNAFVNQIQSVWRTAESQYMNDSLSGKISNKAFVYASNCTETGNTYTNCRKLDITDTGLQYCVQLSASGSITSALVSDANYNATVSSFNISASDSAIVDGHKDLKATTNACAFN